MDDLISLDRKNVWHPFTPLQSTLPMPLVTKAEGVYLHTQDGKRIIDAVSSWWVNLHGHCNPVIAEAIAVQAQTLEHVIFAGFTHQPAIELSQKLLSALPSSFSRVFYSDNGSTAVEVALKMAIQYWHDRGEPKRKIIAIRGGYHGDTFGSMSVAERGLFTAPFSDLLFETLFIDFPSPGMEDDTIQQFKELVNRGDVAAFIFEPLVQAAGGMRMYSSSCLDTLIGYARDASVICIADEVFTGFGRTGKTFAIDYLQNLADIVALSKGVTGGFMPLGVTACAKWIADGFDSPALDRTFFHGHSYTANPLACAAANASFNLLMGAECQENIQRISRQQLEFSLSLKGNKKIIDARTLGTILAIEVKTNHESNYANSLRTTIYNFFMERGILMRPLGNTLYVLPPYVITREALTYIHKCIEEFLDQLA